VIEYFDSHCHVTDAAFRDDREAVLHRASEAGVTRLVTIASSVSDAQDALSVARERPGVWCTAGVHPHEAAAAGVGDIDAVRELALAHAEVVAIGETGLDFHYDHSPRAEQEAAFRRSIRMAGGASKPLVVHVREADEACARVLREEGVPAAGGVIHCFTGDAAAARAYLDLGLLISVAGVVTFRTADAIRDAVRLVPRDRLLVETDCPFLAPVPYRGRRNEPAYVVKTAEKVAELWGASLDDVAQATTANVKRLFRIG
jgi:TatD DNase family protein